MIRRFKLHRNTTLAEVIEFQNSIPYEHRALFTITVDEDGGWFIETGYWKEDSCNFEQCYIDSDNEEDYFLVEQNDDM